MFELTREMVLSFVSGAVIVAVILGWVFNRKLKEKEDLLQHWYRSGLDVRESQRKISGAVNRINQFIDIPHDLAAFIQSAIKENAQNPESDFAKRLIQHLDETADLLRWFNMNKSNKFQFYITDGRYYLKDPLSEMVRVGPMMLSQVPHTDCYEVHAVSIKNRKLYFVNEDGKGFYPKEWYLSTYERCLDKLSWRWSKL